MSKATITKEVKTTVCDFCDKEIDTKSDDYCWSHLQSKIEPYVRQERGVKHLILSIERLLKRTTAEPDKYVQYDFHATCFDELMRKFLSAKGNHIRR